MGEDTKAWTSRRHNFATLIAVRRFEIDSEIGDPFRLPETKEFVTVPARYYET
jgi:hypothetical protein